MSDDVGCTDGAKTCRGSRPSVSVSLGSEVQCFLSAEEPPAFFEVTSGGVLSDEYGPGGSGVCLGDGQREAERVPTQDGRGDALLRRMPPYLTWCANWG